jgi:hypothetical protein
MVCLLLGFLFPKCFFSIILVSNILTLSLPDESYSWLHDITYILGRRIFSVLIIFTLFRNSKTNSQYNLFFRKSYRITDIPGNRLISVSYMVAEKMIVREYSFIHWTIRFVFILFFSISCTLCWQFLWIVHFERPFGIL